MPHFKLSGEESITRYLSAQEMQQVFSNIYEWPSFALKLLSEGKFYPQTPTAEPTPLPFPKSYCYLNPLTITLWHASDLLANFEVHDTWQSNELLMVPR